MNVPFLDLKSQYEPLADEIQRRIATVLNNTAYILGEDVSQFEQDFAAFVESQHCVGVASGCDALAWGLRACGVEPGDEVITVANTFIATALAISSVGATIKLVDCNEDDYLMNIDQLEAAITDKTKAIIPVHLYGQGVDMTRLLELANKYNLAVVEDTCQSHGAKQNGKNLGTFGDVGCFSFYPGKNLGAYGDAGAAVSNSKEHAGFINFARNYGQSKKYHHDVLGWNSRMDTVQAAVLNVKLPHLAGWNEARYQVALKYIEGMKDLPVIMPKINEGNTHVFHLFIARHPERDQIMEFLGERGVSTGLHYPVPIHLQNCYKDTIAYSEGDFPVAEKYAHEIMSLPIFPEMTDEQVTHVIESMHAYFKR